MFDFIKLCNEYESLGSLERSALLAERSVKVLARLRLLDIPGIDPVETFAAFVIGAVAADGEVNEREYLLIYPALRKVFGDEFDYGSVKRSFKKDCEGRRQIKDRTADMLKILGCLDEDLKKDVIGLCLCIVAVDGKISLRERMYLKKLCRA